MATERIDRILGRVSGLGNESVEAHYAAVRNTGHPLADAYLAAEARLAPASNDAKPADRAA